MKVTSELDTALIRLETLIEKFNPYHDSQGRFSSGSGGGTMAPDTGGGFGGGKRSNEERMVDARKEHGVSKGTNVANNKELVEASGIKYKAPKDMDEAVERTLAHVVSEKFLQNQLKGVTIEFKPMGRLYGQSKGKKLYIDSDTLAKEGPGFAAAIVRHELQHTILTNQKVPSGQQESKVRAVAGIWAAMKYGGMAKTNPSDGLGFRDAARAQGFKI